MISFEILIQDGGFFMKLKTKELVLAALLTSMAIVIPNVFPSLPLGPFTATAFSHLPVMIAMFISPVVALAAAVGSAIGFLIKCASMLWVPARAAMHIPFAITGAILLKKHWNPYLVCLVTLLMHASLEVLILFPFLQTMPAQETWQMVTFVGTAIHHLIDFAVAVAVLLPLHKAKFVSYHVKEGFRIGKNKR